MKNWAILDPYIDTPSVETIAKLSARLQGQIHFTTYSPAIGKLPSLDNHFDGFISLGSNAYVTDSDPWIKKLAKFLEHQLNAHKKVLGICFTHQLMAQHFGGKVDFIYPDQRGLKGIRKILLTQELGEFKDSIDLVYTQHQRVFEIPNALESLGASMFEFEILRHKKLNYLSFQAHPEAGDDFCRIDALMTDADEIKRAQHYGDRVIDSFILS